MVDCVYKVKISTKSCTCKVIVLQPVWGSQKQKISIISKSPGRGMDPNCISTSSHDFAVHVLDGRSLCSRRRRGEIHVFDCQPLSTNIVPVLRKRVWSCRVYRIWYSLYPRQLFVSLNMYNSDGRKIFQKSRKPVSF